MYVAPISLRHGRPTRSSSLNIVLWILQFLLALAFLAAGVNHATRPDRPRPGMEWMLAVPKPLLRTIGILEIAGAIGLVVPAATGIAPWLTVVAAACLALLMVLAAVFHARRPGESRNAAGNLAFGGLALVVLVGLLVAAPLG